MHRFRRKFILDLFKLSDSFILLVALFLSHPSAINKASSSSVKGFIYYQVEIISILYVLMLIAIWHLIFSSFWLYGSRRIGSRTEEVSDIVKATTVGSLVLTLLTFTLYPEILSFRFIILFWLLSGVLTILFRISLRYLLGKIRAFGRNLRHVLIVGTNKRAYDFAEMIEAKKEAGYRLVGFVDNGVYTPNRNIEVLGTLEDFPDIVKRSVIDEVVISLPIKSHYDEISKIVKKAEEHGVVIRYLSQLFETKVAKSTAELFEGYTVMTMSSGPQSGWQLFIKRMLDLTLSSFLLLLMLPFMISIAAVIRLTSKGPVLFVQDRVGYNKRIFRFYKFRTMVVNAEKLQSELESRNEMAGPVFKIRNDPRVTGVGKWLRKFSLDELPQLFNVLKGDMSLVGPRPLPMRDFNNFAEDWLHRRCSVIPGITGAWQINGRSDTDFDEWIKLDMQYIDNWKLYDDFKILVKTIPVVIKGAGAS